MTPISDREYFEMRLLELDRRYEQRFAASQEAVAKAERSMNERLNGMNEFREALKDQASRMATRIELEGVSSTVDELRRNKANLDGRMTIVAGAIALVVSLLTAWLRK